MAAEKKKAPAKKKGPSPFDYANSINSDIECRIGTEALPLRSMNRFMLTRSMMTHVDTVLLGEHANMLVYTPDEYVFRFLHSMVHPKKRRFGKFPKLFKDLDRDKIDDLCSRYCISSKDARLILENEELDSA